MYWAAYLAGVLVVGALLVWLEKTNSKEFNEPFSWWQVIRWSVWSWALIVFFILAVAYLMFNERREKCRNLMFIETLPKRRQK